MKRSVQSAELARSRVLGVAVEAISSALMEDARSTLTDGAGRYRVEDLPPGSYRVRFTLAGWKTHHVEGVHATASMTTIVNARLAAGPITETITVPAEPPVIDVHDARRSIALTGDDIRVLPTARTYNALLALLPGLVANVTDPVAGPSTTAFALHGGRQNEGRLMLDGLTIGSPPSGNSAASYDVDVARAQGSDIHRIRWTGRVGDAVGILILLDVEAIHDRVLVPEVINGHGSSSEMQKRDRLSASRRSHESKSASDWL